MSIFETITTDIHDVIEQHGGSAISPTTVALSLQARYATNRLEPVIAYTSLEHLKQMARSALRRRFDAADAPATEQTELFSGQLQERYPVPTPNGEDPVYKRLEDLSETELTWNEARLGKTADALMEHRRTLAAYRQEHFGPLSRRAA